MSKGAMETAKAARMAFEASQAISSQERSEALLAVRVELERQKERVLEANRQDMNVTRLIKGDTATHIPVTGCGSSGECRDAISLPCQAA